MKKFIHIRGATGSGKSTAVCQYLLKTDGFVLYKILIGHKSYPYYYNKSKKVLVTGVYGNKTCGGCDGVINSKEIMIKYLIKLIDIIKPDFVIFEAVMYGITVKFAQELSGELNKRGYYYKGIAFIPPYEFCLRNILKRNKGKCINLKNLRNKCLSAMRSARTLKESGADIEFIDTSKIKISELSEIIERELVQ